MPPKRKGSFVNTNFRPSAEFQAKTDFKGIKPLPDPVSVRGALLTMIIHVCRKVIFVDTKWKVAAYIAVLFFSLIADLAPFPRSYFSRSSNALNQYFVKLGWAWTLICTLPFVVLTSFTYCCGNRRMVGWHAARLGVATIAWFVFTKSFAYLEVNTGRCSVRSKEFTSKPKCLSAGHFWDSIDISGHAFILIYSALVMIEEARAIIGWETIPDLIRNEEHQRSVKESNHSSPMKNLSKQDIDITKLAFKTFTPYVRSFFIAMTLLTCLWDVMILSTALYFHTMVEKLISGVLAICVWYVTYHVWYPRTKYLPYAPGRGVFQYNKQKQVNGNSNKNFLNRKSDAGPTFMGMPLHQGREAEEEEGLKNNLVRVGASRNQTRGDS